MRFVVAVVVFVWTAITLPSVAFAQTVTVSYEAVVTSASGPNAAAFPAGTPGVVSYTLDPGRPDGDASPNQGFFSDAGAIAILFRPAGGQLIQAGMTLSDVQTFDNVVDSSSGRVSDQFLVAGGMAAPNFTPIGFIDSLEVGFQSAFVTPPTVPTMLTSDAMPLVPLSGASRSVLLHTNAGWTSVRFSIAPLPGPPTGFQATVSGNVVNMSWAAPTSGGPPQSYTILARLQVGGPVIASLPVGLATSFGVTAPNGAFVLTIRATNASGTGPESSPVTVTVPQSAPAPTAPTGLAVSIIGGTATLSWIAPTGGGPVVNYLLVAGSTPGFVVPLVSLPLPATPGTVIPGIPPGTYYARVMAQNSGGVSAPSNEVTIVVANPAPPSSPFLNPPTVAGNSLTLSWVPSPPGGGGVATSYLVSAALTPGGPAIVTVPIATTTAFFTGVPPGIYYVRVTAVNAVGPSAPSNEVTVVVP